VQGKHVRVHLIFSTVLLGLTTTVSFAEEDTAQPPPVAIVISVAEQKMALLHDGGVVKKYPVSTSKFGLGDRLGSYKTPLGRLRVCDKIGDGLAPGAVIKHRSATGEILPVNAAGRDPIVTRILWLEGLEATNDNARGRGIYIHGTVEESKVGDPVSYGCIRMKSRDVAELFAATPVGTPVEIVEGKLPRFHRADPSRPEVVLAKSETAPARSSLAVAPRPAEKPETRSGSALFGEKAALSKTAKHAADSAPQPARVSSRAVLLAEGREVAPASADESSRRIEVSMKKSILFAGLPEIAAAPKDTRAEKSAARTR
jgi:hypothetical protein